MSLRPFLFILLLLLAAAVSPASAVEEITQNHTKNFSLQSPEGLSLSGIEIYNLAPDSNVSVVLDNYGEIYTLQVNNTRKLYSWWEFDVSLTSPNGTTEHKILKSLAPVAINYDVHVQYYWQGLNNTIDTSYFDIDVYTGILPLEATLHDYNPTKSKPLQFSQITTSSDSYYDLVCYAVTPEEFEKQLKNDPLAPLFELSGDIFTWSWNAIIRFVGLIPFIGDDLVTAIQIASYIIEETFFYFKLFFIEYVETTILTLEFFIVTYSLHRTKTRSPVKLVKNVVSDHIAVFEFIIEKTRLAIDLLIRIVHVISSIVQSLKPI